MKKSRCVCPHRGYVGALGIVVLALLGQVIGCGGSAADLPETFEVIGTVLQADGTPLSGGLVEFQATTGPPVTTNSEIKPDGTFTLVTMVEGEQLPGAVPGIYRVVIMPMMSDQSEEQHMIEPITVPETYEVKSAGANEFTIELKRQRGR